jgi:LmbE family N-acetylglucosaminyl deacetylase
MPNLRLLCVTAHPDDEAGGFGGALLLYHGRGVETNVICLTPGQAAKNRGGHVSDEDLAAARRKEFAAACEILKITRGEVLDFPDSRLDRVDLYRAVGELVLRIRQIRPHLVITFGTEGGHTAHPDHTMASILATLAYHWAGRSNRYTEQLSNGLQPYRAQKLYHTTSTFTLPDRQPISLAPPTAVIDIEPFFETKINAFKAHLTQAPLFPLFEKTVRKRGKYEMYHLAANVHPGPVQSEDDLFAGVVAD